ncbi:MAG: RsmB/NOP family class I SAM-dependent RNA methyltransferase [Hyphomicrobiales bacterium]|nr:MAG: RsmB/NOP family class I SAM-dependent RNA methyltransferase [Hyphomicrobiales bacterium]
MTPSAILTATLDLMQDIATLARPADAVVSGWVRQHRDIGEGDRGQIIELCYALLRHQGRLGWWLAQQGADDGARNRLLAWLALSGRAPEQIAKLFSGGREAPAALSADELALVTKLRGADIDSPSMPEELRVECPDWAVEPLRRRFGDAFAREMAALLTAPPLDLRVNPLKATRDEMVAALRDLGFQPTPLKLAPLGIRLPERVSLSGLPMLRSGAVEIQDEGSQLVAMLVGARPGERVADFCAGAGGKTLALAAAMNNRGHIVACDVSEARLKRSAERFRRACFHNVETRLLSSETDRWVKRHKLGYDRVLVDAPCTGTGTWRRNPDARWRALGEGQGLDNLVPLQARILMSAARLVKPGGRLVYATCSMLPEENEAQVEAFLAASPDFELVKLGEVAPGLSSAHPDYLSLTPAQHNTDGFFAAVLQRKQAPAAE